MLLSARHSDGPVSSFRGEDFHGKCRKWITKWSPASVSFVRPHFPYIAEAFIDQMTPLTLLNRKIVILFCFGVSVVHCFSLFVVISLHCLRYRRPTPVPQPVVTYVCQMVELRSYYHLGCPLVSCLLPSLLFLSASQYILACPFEIAL